MGNLKLAFRMLFKTPFVTVVAILSLALGIGANAAIFSLFNQMLLRPLPVHRPTELVNLAAPGPKPGSTSCNIAGDCETVFSYPMYRDLESRQEVFSGLAAHRIFGANLAARGETTNGEGLFVSGSYFSVLGLQPALGRLLNQSDDRAIGESPAVVLSHAFWRTRFGADPAIIDQTMVVNGQALTIVGVAPEGFDGTSVGVRPQVYVPVTLRGLLQPGWTGFENRRSYWIYLFGRLRPGATIEQARATLGGQYRSILNEVEAPLQENMSEQTLARFREKPLLMEDGRRGQSSIEREAGEPLMLLMGVTIFVLLIACANIANLLLARAASRSGEMAIRLSIGASRRLLIGQLLTESLVLAALGGLAGLFVAQWTLAAIGQMLSAEALATLTLTIDTDVMLFAGALAIGTGLVFGLFPAIHSSRPDLLSTIKGTSGQPSGARSATWFRRGLATSQIAMSMALLGASGLFVKSLYNVSRVDLGLDIEQVVTFRLSPQLNGYPVDRIRTLFRELETELAVQPGVTAVTASTVPLLSGSNWGTNVSVQGFDAGPDTDTNSRFNLVGPGYLRTMGVPLLAGRDFTESDAAGAPRVAIVNETFARKFNMGRDVVGRRMATGMSTDLDIEIVGLARDAKYSEVKGEIPPLFFRPWVQNEQISSMSFYVRMALDPDQFVASIPPLVRRLDPNLPVEDLRTMPQQVRENVFVDRIITTLSASFAVLATLLAAVGLYGVLAYTVSQRTREFGLRLALGAGPGRVRGLVLRQVGWMMLIGGALGAYGAVKLGELAASMLYGLEGSDPAVLASAAGLLGVVALAAGYIPALRASRVDPMQALRYE